MILAPARGNVVNAFPIIDGIMNFQDVFFLRQQNDPTTAPLKNLFPVSRID
jgi:hypothetical protein